MLNKIFFRRFLLSAKSWPCMSTSFLCKAPFRTFLSETLTPELIDELSGEITSKQFRIRAIQRDIENWEADEFPLPACLKINQWKNLMLLEERSSRLFYLDSIVQQVDSDEHFQNLLADDRDITGELQLDPEVVSKATGNDPCLMEKMATIRLLHETERLKGEQLPSRLTFEQLQELLLSRSRTAILAQLRFYVHKRTVKLKEFIKKRVKRKVGLDLKQKYDENVRSNNHIIYGLGHNTIMNRIYDRTMETFDDANVIREYNVWGQPLVIDMSFVYSLTVKQTRSLMFRELTFSLRNNKKSLSPFSMYLSNVNPHCSLFRYMYKALPLINEPEFPLVVSDKSYLELFPHERLIYLSPDSRNDLLEFDEDDIYIVGGIVDSSSGIPHTLTKAKKEGIRHARLPLKRYIGIAPELNVDHVISILNDFRFTKDWFFSFRWVPSRFFRNRLKGVNYSRKMELIYHSHHALSPSHNENLVNMRPKQYRQQYAAYLSATV